MGRVAVRVPVADVSRYDYAVGWRAERPFLQFAFGLGWAMLCAIPLRIGLAHIQSDAPEHMTAGRFLILAAPGVALGIFMMGSSLRRGQYVVVHTRSGARRKLLIRGGPCRDDLLEFLSTVLDLPVPGPSPQDVK